MTEPGAKALTGDEIIALLGLTPHPEGGHYRETFRDGAPAGGRAHSSAIYYLLQAGEVSRWHRVDAAELWHWYGGAALELQVSSTPGETETHHLGIGLGSGERPQAIVPAGFWQSARSLGPWSLVGCTVAPAFEFEGLEFGQEGWTPGEGNPG